MPDKRAAGRPRGSQSAATREAQFQPEFLVRMLNEAFHGPAWHGPALQQTLAGCTHGDAERRLAAGRNTIHELVLHTAYGKHILRSRLTNEHRRFPRPLARSWWPRIVDSGPDGWLSDLGVLGTTHADLIATLGTMSSAKLARKRTGKRHTLAEELLGLVLHDIYHAGQIALIRKVVSA